MVHVWDVNPLLLAAVVCAAVCRCKTPHNGERHVTAAYSLALEASQYHCYIALQQQQAACLLLTLECLCPSLPLQLKRIGFVLQHQAYTCIKQHLVSRSSTVRYGSVKHESMTSTSELATSF